MNDLNLQAPGGSFDPTFSYDLSLPDHPEEVGSSSGTMGDEFSDILSVDPQAFGYDSNVPTTSQVQTTASSSTASNRRYSMIGPNGKKVQPNMPRGATSKFKTVVSLPANRLQR